MEVFSGLVGNRFIIRWNMLNGFCTTAPRLTCYHGPTILAVQTRSNQKTPKGFVKKKGKEDTFKTENQPNTRCDEGYSRYSSVLKLEKQSQWLIKNTEVFQAKFEHLGIVTSLFTFDDWREI